MRSSGPGREADDRALRRACIRFTLRFSASLAAGLLLLAAVPWVSDASCRMTATHVAFILKGAGIACSLAGKMLYVGPASIEIVPGCTSTLPMILLVGAIFAFPSNFLRKVVGIALAAAALWVVNLARVLTLIWILVAAPNALDLVHVYLWRIVISTCTLAFFVLWARRPVFEGGVLS